MLYFSGNEKNVNAEVYNSLGQMVLQVERASSIDFGAMPKGMYLVKVTTEIKKSRVIRVLKE
jgi:hypothetical protein